MIIKINEPISCAYSFQFSSVFSALYENIDAREKVQLYLHIYNYTKYIKMIWFDEDNRRLETRLYLKLKFRHLLDNKVYM